MQSKMHYHARKIDFQLSDYVSLHICSCYYYKCSKYSFTVGDPQSMIRGLSKVEGILPAHHFHSRRAEPPATNLFAQMPRWSWDGEIQVTSSFTQSPTRVLALRQEIHTEAYRCAILLACLQTGGLPMTYFALSFTYAF
jgi:hypothetical protein